MAKRKESPRQSRFELDIVSKFERSNASVEELRTGLWAPIEKFSHNSLILKNFIENKRRRSIETSWGKVTVSGNILTQTHRDLLDCILAVSTNTKELEGGSIAVYFKRSDALKKYGDKSSKNYKWLDEKLNEIQTSSIEFQNKEGKYRFNILQVTAYSEKEESYGIIFTAEYRNYIESKLTIGYLAELDKLLTINSALLKAIIRFFWTHKDASRMTIEDTDNGKPGLLTTVGYPADSAQMIRAAKKEIESQLDFLEQFGIYSTEEEVIKGKRRKITRLLYQKPEDSKITFIAPATSLLPS